MQHMQCSYRLIFYGIHVARMGHFCRHAADLAHYTLFAPIFCSCREPDGSVKLEALIDTALDVARAMAHLHTHNILHSDLKARNVLLRSDAHDPRGFAAKVADFGLSLTIDPNSTHVSNAFQVSCCTCAKSGCQLAV